MDKHLTVLSGTANRELAERVSKSLGTDLTTVDIKRFNDGETYVKIQKSVRGCHVFIIQPTSPPVNDNLMELLIIVDALKRASAKEITAVIPYYGYSRQDRKATSREPITARLVAGLLEQAGVNRVVSFDLHVDQIQGFFDIPVDNLEAMPVLAKSIKERKLKDMVVVAPDVGSAVRARRWAKSLQTDMAIIDKRRIAHGESQVMNLIGEVKGKTAIIIDDIIDTAGTISTASTELMKQGAKEVYICATHGIFSKEAMKKLANKDIKEVIVTDTLPHKDMIDKIKTVSLAPFIAELITSIFDGEPMGIIVQGKHAQI
ncbi:ribose-phosphate pyrophosphokinase [Candidatus Woesearchaeota archaeon]|nr:ribose-phosphate pyrophosphokinase [Candidatus Woesearchaeota archaeon]